MKIEWNIASAVIDSNLEWQVTATVYGEYHTQYSYIIKRNCIGLSWQLCNQNGDRLPHDVASLKEPIAALAWGMTMIKIELEDLYSRQKA